MSTTTTQMLLEIPVVGDSDYPTSMSTSLANIDAHDHSTNKGVQIPTAGIANGAVTQVKRAALGQQISASSGVFNTSAAVLTDVPNLSVTITTTGRPVFIGLIGEGNGNSGVITTTNNGTIAIKEDASVIEGFAVLSVPGFYPRGGFWTVSIPAAGAHTYKIQAINGGGGGDTVSVSQVRLMAYEL